MARPKKQTVDYFPHGATSGKTISILEGRWGVLGYAFWFKLLETLCATNGHVFDYGNSFEREFFLSKTRTDNETGTDILNLLAEMGKIDKELWVVDKLIWCDNLVKNVKDAYSKRIDQLPIKPVSSSIKASVEVFPVPETPLEKVNTSGSTESKVKESKEKVKESKVYNINIPFADIVNYLNLKAKTNYKTSGQKTRDLITARWNDGFVLEDFKTVIDKKCLQWLEDPVNAQYLRPETLFSNKFEGYLNQKVVVYAGNTSNRKSDPNANYGGNAVDYQKSYDDL